MIDALTMMAQTIKPMMTPSAGDKIVRPSGERTILIGVDDVDWIEALQNYVRLHVGPATHVLHVPMNTIEGVLDPGRVLRIHRSHKVNVRRIAPLWSVAHGQYEVELKSGLRLQSGRTYGERLRRALANPF